MGHTEERIHENSQSAVRCANVHCVVAGIPCDEEIPIFQLPFFFSTLTSSFAHWYVNRRADLNLRADSSVRCVGREANIVNETLTEITCFDHASDDSMINEIRDRHRDGTFGKFRHE